MYTIKLQFDKIKCIVSVNTNIYQKISQWDIKRHSNIQYELHIPLSGNCRIDVEKKEYMLSKGNALLIAPGNYHSSVEVSDDYTHFVVQFQVYADNDILNKLLEKVTPCFFLDTQEFDLNICNLLISEIQNKDLFWQESLYSLYSILCTSLFRKLSFISTGSYNKNYSRNDDDRFSLIDNFFERNLAENNTEEDLSTQLNLSRRQLNRVLKMNYGMGFREKMHNSRMDRAEWLLRTTKIPVSQISELVGYNSETSFFKAFKSHYNMTPRKYRQIHIVTGEEE